MMFEHYQLIRELGRGGMGAVYLARDTRLGRRVAIKFLARQGGELAARFLSEARLIARCEHDNIVAIHHAGEGHGHSYMVLEYVEGVTLRQWIQQRWQGYEPRNDAESGGPGREASVSTSLAVELMVPVVRALVHAHAMGLVHPRPSSYVEPAR
jgi:serine/threonine protein kinase